MMLYLLTMCSCGNSVCVAVCLAGGNSLMMVSEVCWLYAGCESLHHFTEIYISRLL